MKRKTNLHFFDISSNIEELPENELFELKGGYSDGTIDGGDLEEVEVTPPDRDEPEDDWGTDDPWNDQEDPWDGQEGDWGDNDGGGSVDNTEDESSKDEGPWKRDSKGKIIATPTNRMTHNNDYPNTTLIMTEHKIEANDGTKITVYRVDTVVDTKTGEHRLPTQAEKSNCFGLAFADGNYWMGVDDKLTPNINEGNDLEKLIDKFYEKTVERDATVVLVDNGTIYHAGIINDDGTYTGKGGTSPEQTYDSIDDFRGELYTSGELVYYKQK